MATALVIDDNRETADSMVRGLELLGLQVRVAYGPSQGLSLLSNLIPDIVFLDLNMPGVNGFELLGFLHREPKLMNVPVFVCTSDDQPQTRLLALQANARELLVKPVTVDMLEIILKEIGLLKK